MHEDLGKELRLEADIICSPGAQEAETGRSLVLLASFSKSVSFRFSKGHTQTQFFCPKGDCMHTHTPCVPRQGKQETEEKGGGVGGKTRKFSKHRTMLYCCFSLEFSVPAMASPKRLGLLANLPLHSVGTELGTESVPGTGFMNGG